MYLTILFLFKVSLTFELMIVGGHFLWESLEASDDSSRGFVYSFHEWISVQRDPQSQTTMEKYKGSLELKGEQNKLCKVLNQNKRILRNFLHKVFNWLGPCMHVHRLSKPSYVIFYFAKYILLVFCSKCLGYYLALQEESLSNQKNSFLGKYADLNRLVSSKYFISYHECFTYPI